MNYICSNQIVKQLKPSSRNKKPKQQNWSMSILSEVEGKKTRFRLEFSDVTSTSGYNHLTAPYLLLHGHGRALAVEGWICFLGFGAWMLNRGLVGSWLGRIIDCCSSLCIVSVCISESNHKTLMDSETLPHCSSKNSFQQDLTPMCVCVCVSIPINSATINLAQSWIANTKMQKGYCQTRPCLQRVLGVLLIGTTRSSSLSFASTDGCQLGDVFVCRFTFLAFFLTLGVNFVTPFVSSVGETSWLERLNESSSTSCGETGSFCDLLNSI